MNKKKIEELSAQRPETFMMMLKKREEAKNLKILALAKERELKI